MAKSPKDLTKLTDVWYKRLKDSGFDDIETRDGQLKSSPHSSKFLRAVRQTSWQEKQAYYYMAEHFLNSYKFDNKVDEIIWEYHTNGIGTRDIADLLKKAGVKHKGRYPVWLVIKRLREVMKETYSAKALEQEEDDEQF